jgi:ABC-2 type transport system ATP-binding protein
MRQNVLEVANLNKSYPAIGKDPPFRLKDVSFSLPPGCILGFIGMNGAGKTTTLKSILNIVRPDSGTVRFMGEDFYANEEKLKQDIGFMLGGADYYQKTKVKKIIAVFKRFFSAWDDAVFTGLLSRFGINAEKKTGELSAGMKVKLNLAMALSHDAKLLILDEPTSGLDPVARNELLELFREIAGSGKRGILFSTHITTDLDKCADRVMFIRNGELLACDALPALIEKHRFLRGGNPNLEDIMLHYHRPSNEKPEGGAP